MELVLYYTIYFAAFGSGFMLGLGLFSFQFEPKVRLVLDFENSYYDTQVQGKKYKAKRSKLARLLNIFGPLNERIIPRFDRAGLEEKLSCAKVPLSLLEFLAVKEISMFILPLLFYIIRLKVDIVWMIILAIVGFFLPDIWLRNRIAKRKRHIIKALPETVDILSLCVSAGLDFMLAVRWLIDKSEPNPLVEELSTVMYEIKMGRSRRDALREMGKRLDLADVNTFVRTLVQADRMGTPVSEALAILSDDARNVRFRRGERLARTAPLKLLIPLIFFILPSILLVVGGPIALQFLRIGARF
ncbi:MAG: type II secretion system F family protein [Candidatus Omnitrophota bacterium]